MQPLFTSSYLQRAPTLMFFQHPQKNKILQLLLSGSTHFHLYRLQLVQRRQHVFPRTTLPPLFLILKHVQYNMQKTYITMHTNYVLICFWIYLCTLVPLIVSVLDIIERTHSPLSFHIPHFYDGQCTNSLPTESTPLASSHVSSYTYQSLNPSPICMHDC